MRSFALALLILLSVPTLAGCQSLMREPSVSAVNSKVKAWLPKGYAAAKRDAMNRVILKPPGMGEQSVAEDAPAAAVPQPVAATPLPMIDDTVVITANDPETLTWNELPNYQGTLQGSSVPMGDLAPIGSPQPSGVTWQAEDAPQPQTYNRNVTVFPVEGDIGGWQAPAYTDLSGRGIPVSVVSSEGVRLMDAEAQRYGYESAGDMVTQLFFAHGSARIAPADKTKVRDLANAVLRTQGGAYLRVVGHASRRVDGVTDPIQAELINFEMAMKRAAAVTQALYDAGVTPSWVETASRGDKEAGGRQTEARDRRVDIFMRGK